MVRIFKWLFEFCNDNSSDCSVHKILKKLEDDNYKIALDEVKLNEKVIIAGEEYTIVGNSLLGI